MKASAALVFAAILLLVPPDPGADAASDSRRASEPQHIKRGDDLRRRISSVKVRLVRALKQMPGALVRD